MSERAFLQSFKFDDKRTPYGCSLEELMRSGIFVESSPVQFTFSVAGPRDISLPDQFSAYVTFSDKHKENHPLLEARFPLFCHFVMKMRRKSDENSVRKFAEANIRALPDEFKDQAQKFIDDDKYFHDRACLFETQWYKLKTDDESWSLLNDFLNQPQNSELRMNFINAVVCDPIRKETDDKRPAARLAVPWETSPLSITQCRLENATAARIPKDFSGVFATFSGQYVYKLDTRTSQKTPLYTHSSTVTAMTLSSESTVLVTSDIGGTLNLWSAHGTGKINIINTPLWCAEFAPRGGVFAVGGSDMHVRMFDTSQQHEFRRFVGHTGAVTDVAWHPNCSMIGSLSMDPSVRLWDVRQASTVRLFIGRQRKNTALAFSPNGKYLAFHDGEKLCVCDIGSGRDLCRKPVRVADMSNIVFSMDSRYVLGIGRNREIVSCDLSNSMFPVSDLAGTSQDRVISCEMTATNELRIVTSHDL